MKRLAFAALVFLGLSSPASAVNFYPIYAGLTGSSAGTLASLNGESLTAGDRAIVILDGDPVYGTVSMEYVLRESGAAANPPDVVAPALNAGGKRWHRVTRYRGATLDDSSLVVQNPANATATPTANKIPIADANGQVVGWVFPTLVDTNLGPYQFTGGSFATPKESGVPGMVYLYAANGTDTTGVGFLGPATAAAAKVIQIPGTWNSGDVLSVAGTASSGTGTKDDPYVYAGSWVPPGTGGAIGGAYYLVDRDQSSNLPNSINLGALTTGFLKATVAGGVATISTDASNGAPTDAHYLTTQAESGLSAEANLGALSTGYLKATVAGGVATISTDAGTGITSGYAAANDQVLSASDMNGTKVIELATGSKYVRLPTAAAGLRAWLDNSTAAGTLTIKTASASDVFTIDGATALDAGEYLECGNGLSLVYSAGTNAWRVRTLQGTACVDGGADTYGSFEIDSGASFDYADTETGGSRSQIFTATVTGSVTFQSPAETLTGTNGSDWHIDSTTCSGTITDTTCTATIHFAPTTVGEKSATLTFKSDIADVTVALTGTAVDTTAPELIASNAIEILSSGTSVKFKYTEAVTAVSTADLCGTDWAFAMTTAGTLTLAYGSGDGTSEITCTFTPTVYAGDTVANGGVDYTQPGDGSGILDASDNELATLTNHAVLNSSSATLGVTDDFSGDLSNWTSSIGTWVIDTAQLKETGGAHGYLLHNSADMTANQHACIQLPSFSWSDGTQAGLAFRASNSGDKRHYALFVKKTGGSLVVTWEEYADSSWVAQSSDTWAEAFGEGDYLCGSISGSSLAPALRAWHKTSAPGPYSGWGSGSDSHLFSVEPIGYYPTGTLVGLRAYALPSGTRLDNFSAGPN